MNQFWRKKAEQIEFKCYADDWDVIPKPYPASQWQPEWFKSLKHRVIDDGAKEAELKRTRFFSSKSNKGKQAKGFYTSTVKRCTPLVEALSAGWIIPLAQDVHIRSNKDCSMLDWEFQRGDKPMVEVHERAQIGDENHPAYPKWPFKWRNWWQITTPPGISLMFVDPLNRKDNRLFTCFDAIVEADWYDEFINFPFTWNVPDFNGVVPVGTPLVQVIPIRRTDYQIDGKCSSFTDKDLQDLQKTRLRRTAHMSYYRDRIRAGKGQIDKCPI
jgi:hypothetical protein